MIVTTRSTAQNGATSMASASWAMRLWANASECLAKACRWNILISRTSIILPAMKSAWIAPLSTDWGVIVPTTVEWCSSIATVTPMWPKAMVSFMNCARLVSARTVSSFRLVTAKGSPTPAWRHSGIEFPRCKHSPKAPDFRTTSAGRVGDSLFLEKVEPNCLGY